MRWTCSMRATWANKPAESTSLKVIILVCRPPACSRPSSPSRLLHVWFLRSYFSNDLAIDLGTENTLIYVRGKGIVLDEPSVVAIRTEGGPNASARFSPSAMRRSRCSARRRQHHCNPPMKDGVIADFVVTEQMIKHSSRRCTTRGCFSPSPRIIICVPCGSTQVERRAIRDAALAAGASQVYLIEEPRAAAIGAGLPCPTRPARWSSTSAAARPKSA